MMIGAACLAAAGGAYGLKPHRRLSLLGSRVLDQVVPRTVGGWTSRDVSDLVAPTSDDDLAARLYNQTIERIYLDAATGAEVMMLIAHGDSQTNDLQLHRPEVCYPSFGYDIVSNVTAAVPLAAGLSLPARRLTAKASDHAEFIVYWTRLGEYLPTDGRQQRLDRLKTAMAGYVADGVLARFSAVDTDPSAAFARLSTFIAQLLRAVPNDARPALVGSSLAGALSAAGA
jgi:EpsI family protein